MAYLQTAIGHSVDDPSIADIQTAIDNIHLDEEHAAFWYGTDEEEIVLETHGNLKGFLIIEGGEQQEIQFETWQEVLAVYNDLIEGRWNLVKSKFGVS